MLHSEEKAQHLAGHDTLSGLPNRLRFTEHLEALLSRIDREDSGLAVVFVDLDKFKEVNDTYGHAAGDLVIVGCAERMASQLRANDVLARFGGDEFAIIQTGVKSPRDAEALARRIIESIRPAFQIGEAEAYVGASIGIALAPENASDAAELMRLADIAMYRAKNSGRNRACFFEQRMDDTLRIRKVVEDDCATPSPGTSWSCITSRRSPPTGRASRASRRSSAGAIPSTGSFPRLSSSASPRSAA